MNEIGLQILNYVWDGLNEATWYTEEKFTLDYVCMDGRGLKKVVGASILDLGEVIESDHAAIRVEIENTAIDNMTDNRILNYRSPPISDEEIYLTRRQRATLS